MNKVLLEISQPNLIETFHLFLYFFRLLFGGDLTGLRRRELTEMHLKDESWIDLLDHHHKVH